jgi:predicted amidohydrolase
MPQGVRVSVVQSTIHGISDNRLPRENLAINARHYAALIDRVCRLGDAPPALIVFPVLILNATSFPLLDNGVDIFVARDEFAVDLTGGDAILDPLLDACRRNGVHICSTCIEKSSLLPGRFMHTGFVLGPDGLVLRSPKIQAATLSGIGLLRDILDEYIGAFGIDGVLPVADTPFGRIGCLVEGEVHVAQSAEILARKGAQIILHPTVQRASHEIAPYLALKQAHAYHNGLFWVSAAASAEVVTNAGRTLGETYAGGTEIIGPDGRVMAQIVGSGEGIATADIALDAIATARARQSPHTIAAANVYAALFAGLGQDRDQSRRQ